MAVTSTRTVHSYKGERGEASSSPTATNGFPNVSTPIRVATVDPTRDGAMWDREVLEHGGHTPFHSAAWCRLLTATYRHRPHFLRIGCGGGKRALVPLAEIRSPITGCRGVCMPFSDLCAPLVSAEFDERELRCRLATLAHERRWKTLELRGGSLGGVSTRSTTPTYFGHRLDLGTDLAALFDGCNPAVRRAIRKALRAGLKIRIGTGSDSLKKFYQLHARTRRRHGLPPQPFSFFNNLHSQGLVGEGAGFVVLAEKGGRALSASVFLCFGTSAIYKFGASDERAWKLRPNNLTMWEGIRLLAERGFERLHFGRSSVSQGGLRRFKRSWGAKEDAIYYLRFDTRSNCWSAVQPSDTSSMARAVFSRMPLAVNRLAGTVLYRHLD